MEIMILHSLMLSLKVGVVEADGLLFVAFSETVLRFLALEMTVLLFLFF